MNNVCEQQNLLENIQDLMLKRNAIFIYNNVTFEAFIQNGKQNRRDHFMRRLIVVHLSFSMIVKVMIGLIMIRITMNFKRTYLREWENGIKYNKYYSFSLFALNS
ncbi:unnamed protein product [Paramecium sonneborni]|uniref:Uncharacterized protein n=1 Tax=Paramecium sonneborni TaxID=65129 RepID=A0A8S1RKA8_9CILI|nr:unnamed protein product [Paramecium sonneborni]